MIYLELFYVFFLIGAFTFGGGYAMVAMIQQQVAERGWMSTERIIDFVAIAESTPGPIAVNMATFVGTEYGGLLGAVCATLGVVLPSFIVILIVARCYQAFRKSQWVQAVMSGLKPAVVGLIGAALLTVVLAIFAPSGEVLPLGKCLFWGAVAVVMFLVSRKFKKLHPIVIICICALVGIAAGYLGL